MTLRREHFLIFLSPLVLVTIAIGFYRTGRHEAILRAEETPGEALYREVMDLARRRYVVEPDVEDLIYGAADGMLKALDEHCAAMDPERWAQHGRTAQGHYLGVGIIVGRLRGHVSALDVLEGGPAAHAGMRPGDRLLAIGGRPVDDEADLDRVLEALRGRPGTAVLLQVAALDGGERREISVDRGDVPQLTAYGYMLDVARRIGYIHVAGFRENTLDLFDQEMRRLQADGLSGLVLDLRGNPGGSLDVAVELADRFLSEGPIVTTVGRVPQQSRVATSFTPYAAVPLVILADGTSASASEVFAGALQDDSRAVLVGERTYGKGVVQEVAPFTRSGYAGGYKITTAHYFTPAGRNIEKSVALGQGRHRRGGLQPDVPVHLTARERALYDARRQRGRYDRRVREILEEEEDRSFHDRQLEAALSILEEAFVPDRALAAGG